MTDNTETKEGPLEPSINITKPNSSKDLKNISQTSTDKKEETTTSETSTTKTDETADAKGSEHLEGYEPDAEGKYTHPESKEKVSPDDMVKFLATKFAASTKGAQELLDKIKAANDEGNQSKATIAQFEKDIAELRKVAEGKNPEGAELHDLQTNLSKATNELAIFKENASLDAFEKKEPLSAQKRDALKNLARANPKEDLQKLWDENLKAGVEASVAKAKAEEESRKKTGNEKGKGTSTKEGGAETVKSLSGKDTGLTLEDFNKLSVEERKKKLEI